MAEVNVEAGLRQLSECLREIQSLLVWQELVQAEAKAGTPPSFRLDHRIDEHARFKAGLSMQTAVELREVLTRSQTCASQQEDVENPELPGIRFQLSAREAADAGLV